MNCEKSFFKKISDSISSQTKMLNNSDGVSFEEMIAMDIEYARNPSLSQDIKILLWTVPAVFSGDGAG